MSIKTQLADLRLAMAVEDGEERQGKVGALITEIDRAYEDKSSDLMTVNTESKNRKLKIRELESDLEKSQDKITLMEDDDSVAKENTELKSKNEALEEQVTEYNKIRRDTFINDFKSVSEHSDFEKIKEKLKLPEASNGKVDWKDTSDEDIFANQAVVQDAMSFGLFTGTIKVPGTSHQGDIIPPKKGDDPLDGMGGGRSKE